MKAPLDVSSVYVVDDLLRQLADDEEQEPVLAYPASSSGLTDYEFYTPKDLDRLTNAAVQALSDRGIGAVVSFGRCPIHSMPYHLA